MLYYPGPGIPRYFELSRADPVFTPKVYAADLESQAKLDWYYPGPGFPPSLPIVPITLPNFVFYPIVTPLYPP